MKRIIAFAFMAVMLLSACKKGQEVEVLPDFTTEKEVYGINEPIKFINTTVVKNSVPAIVKWEYSGKVFYGETPEGVRFPEVGEYPVTLTVTANDGFVKASVTKNIKVEDHNIRPVADFSWSPTEIKAGDIVTFTDLSTDADGTIVEWEWTIGSGSSKEQNPVYEFVEYGDVKVTLTVTDDMYGKNSKTVVIKVAAGKFRLDLDWRKIYDAAGFTRFTSPAMSPDGNSIYVTSSGGKMVKFSKEGEELWSYDYMTKHNSVFANKAGTSEVCVVTPSVDEDGTVYFAAGFNEPGGSPSGKDNGIMAINPDGTLKWYAYGGPNTRFGWHSPLILKDCIATTQTHSGKGGNFVLNDQGCGILNKADGSQRQTIYATSGSNGGICAYNNKIYVNAAGNDSHKGGTNVGFPTGPNSWALVNGSSTNAQDALWPGYGYHGRGLQPAITKNGEILIYYTASLSNASQGGILYCYDDASVTSTTTVAPPYKWRIEIPGTLSSTITSTSTAATQCGGHGVAVSTDGKIYVTTRTSLVALSATGEILWEHTPGGVIECVPAVDNAGCVYYCDSETGNVVKLNSNGAKLAAIDLGAKLTSSVTISEDGKLYVVGVKDNAPTLFSLSTNDIKGPADNWSQLSGGPCKRSSVFTE